MKNFSMNVAKAFAFCLMLTVAAACSKDDDDPNNPSNSVPDPEGTITVAMRSSGNGGTYVTPDGCYSYFRIYSDDNFEGGYNYFEFVTIGKMSGLGNITKVPTSGWAKKVAVVPGTGYVARCTQYGTYVRIYVVDYIVNTSGGIIGANVKYQSPFEP